MRTARPMQMAHATPGPPGTAGAAVTDQSPIHIVLRGQPRAWKRPNPNRAKPGKFYTAADDDFFHGLLRSEAARVMADLNPIDGPIELSLLAVFKIAKTWPKWKRLQAEAGLLPHTSRPDLDNIIKGIKDTCSAVCYRDDQAISSYGACSKIYGLQPRLEIMFTPIVQPARYVVGKPLAAQADLFAGLAA
jgi:Holliday junction resolvase RusA-like endonuclease